jgi:cytochrome bd-type quinol oxidase subunit 2
MIMVLYPSLFGARGFLDLDTLLDRLSSAFQPVTLFMGVVFATAASVIGLMFLAASKRDHTTYRAAAWAGAKAAGLIIGIVCLIALGPRLLPTLVSRPEEILSPAYLNGVAVSLSGALIGATTGAASGLLFCVVAGAPTVEQNPEA